MPATLLWRRRLVNHNCDPNVGAAWALVKSAGPCGRMELLLYAKKTVLPGEALTADYSASPSLFFGQANAPRPPLLYTCHFSCNACRMPEIF